MASLCTRTLFFFVALVLASSAAFAQSPWKPQKPVELIVGSAAGNSNDLMLRLIAQVTQEKRLLDVPMNVMNKPGGGNTIAWNYLNQHASDGHYLMMANLNLSLGHLTGTTTFSYRDFTPVCLLYDEYVVFVVRNESPIKTGRELLDRLKKDPTSLSLSFSSVAGGANHIAAGLAFKAAGIDVKKVRAVVFDSAGKAITAALGGHVDVVAASASGSQERAIENEEVAAFVDENMNAARGTRIVSVIVANTETHVTVTCQAEVPLLFSGLINRHTSTITVTGMARIKPYVAGN